MPVLAVNIAIIQEEKILLTKREDFEIWCLPGGGVEEGESVAEAAVREAREETGLDVRLTRLVGIYSRTDVLNVIHAILFVAELCSGNLVLQSGETIELGYFEPDKLPQDLVFGHRQRIADVFQRNQDGVAWQQRAVLAEPYCQIKTREELYRRRDESSLSRRDFYFQCFENAMLSESRDL